jgi:DNA invertase Pin-like site-specific DNA recombinase
MGLAKTVVSGIPEEQLWFDKSLMEKPSQNYILKQLSRLLGGKMSFGRLPMLVGYARVSVDTQTTDGQIDALNAAGCERVFQEAMSGTRADRPQLAAALEYAREGDVLVVARLDRLARSMRQLLATVDTLQERGIGLRSLHENIDTTSATGRLSFHVFAAIGQFEVELLRERTKIGLLASRARGRVGGRPPALNAIKVRAARAMLASGTMTAAEVARQVGCSPSTLYRHLPGGRAAVTESGVPAAG